MSWLNKAWSWVKRWGAFLFGALLFVMGGSWFYRRERRKRLDAEARAQAADLKESIRNAKATRTRLLQEDQEQEPLIMRLDAKIRENERVLIELHEDNTAEMTTDEIRERLSQLGY